MADLLPPLKPLPLKQRLSILFIEKGQLDVVDGAFVVVDKTGVRTHIPVGGVACLMLEIGTRISHAAVRLAAQVGTLLVWIGEAGVRLYSAGQPGGARADRLLYQASLALNEDSRLKVVREMYRRRFGADDWRAGDLPNRCLSAATSCLYGVTEAAVLAAGYAPAVGFIHTGKPLSFVYDVADIYKFDTAVPLAFSTAARNPQNPEREIRLQCRDLFRRTRLLDKIIPDIEAILAAGGKELPNPHEDQLDPAIPNAESLGDPGHRA